MTRKDKDFSGSIPGIYDILMVPMFFDAFVRDIAQSVIAIPPCGVLETAVGSGVVTRPMAPLLSKYVA